MKWRHRLNYIYHTKFVGIRHLQSGLCNQLSITPTLLAKLRERICHLLKLIKTMASPLLYSSYTGPMTLAPHAVRYRDTRHLEQIALSHCDANPRLTDEKLRNIRALTQFDWAWNGVVSDNFIYTAHGVVVLQILYRQYLLFRFVRPNKQVGI